MPEQRKRRIGLLRGDPSGIGPEVAAKLLEIPQIREFVDVVALGDTPPECPIGRASAAAGRHALDSLQLAVDVIRRGEIDALVYAPLNKQAMKMAGLEEEDEMRLLARLLGHTGYCSEINICGSLWTTRVTSHVPIAAVAGLITAEKVFEATCLSIARSGPVALGRRVSRWPVSIRTQERADCSELRRSVRSAPALNGLARSGLPPQGRTLPILFL
jgi:4-hydroxythreonine-4-phosphate dehydrogenase